MTYQLSRGRSNLSKCERTLSNHMMAKYDLVLEEPSRLEIAAQVRKFENLTPDLISQFSFEPASDFRST
jgi:hypothetical protein